MLALLVFLSAIVLLFSQEFTRMIQKAAAIMGVKLFVPLIFVSLTIEYYEYWCTWFLLWCQVQLREAILLVSTMLPFQLGAIPFIKISLLFIFASLPACFFWLMKKRKRELRLTISPYYFGYILWIITVFLLITNV